MSKILRGVGIAVIGLCFLADRSVCEVDSVFTPSRSVPVDTDQVIPLRLAIVSGTLLGAIAAVHIYQSNGWWKNNRAPFHFREDLKYALSVDKLGHFHGASGGTYIISKSLRWTNLSETKSLWYGALGSLLFQTYIEVEDGFSVWGFDRVDFASDVAGAFFPVAKHYSPFLQNFDVRFSYHPSPNLDQPGAFPGQKHILLDDYEGQTIWLSLRVFDLLPKSAQPYWPPFLRIAMGYGTRKILAADPYSVLFIGVDLDMTRIIPQTSSFLITVSEVLNHFLLPLPAVQISPGTIWYGLYF